VKRDGKNVLRRKSQRSTRDRGGGRLKVFLSRSYTGASSSGMQTEAQEVRKSEEVQ